MRDINRHGEGAKEFMPNLQFVLPRRDSCNLETPCRVCHVIEGVIECKDIGLHKFVGITFHTHHTRFFDAFANGEPIDNQGDINEGLFPISNMSVVEDGVVVSYFQRFIHTSGDNMRSKGAIVISNDRTLKLGVVI